ncbi:hypothetical protein [Paenibacillus polymyxa]|uniref:Uncharacterized protein n=1 Tax=Paenibacillus polymyxa (strain SC2) TaxID=886882 RepID=E3EK56_PAEPS|nr:hypothetical protein [Paenibacillus polymyxa]ADO59765.1 hypothetical protein PPSC2_26345 [Paenibacillus polymyxa SC2]WPQ60001.1 hypothetical protein SKN87_27545 [Paenibacillus polymyxa]
MIKDRQLTEGEHYTDNKTERLIKSISVEDDLLTYIENPDGGHVLGRSSIQSFVEWGEHQGRLQSE